MNLMKRLPVFFAALCLSAVSCISYEHEVQHSTTDTPIITNDISNQKVTSIAEDAQGHIWIATFRGLNRFNVHEYQQHFCTSSELSIPDNQVQFVYKDSKDRLWVSTVNGMALYTEQDNFIRIPMQTLSRNCMQILESPDGSIFINTMVELAKYDEEACAFVSVLSSVEGKMPAAAECYFSPDGKYLWFTSSTHLIKYDVSTFDVVDAVAIDGYASSFDLLDGKVLWMAGGGKVYRYDLGKCEFLSTPEGLKKHIVFNQAQVSSMFNYGDQVLINTEKHGLFCYNVSEDVLYHQTEQGFPFEFPDVKIKCMFLDSRDNLWIGTYDQGYHVVYAYEERFNRNNWLKSSLGNKSVVAVADDNKGNLWISTLKDGLYLYNMKSELFRRIDLSRAFNNVAAQDIDITHMFVDRDGRLWLSCNMGLVRCKVVNDDLRLDRYWPVFMSMAISQDKDGRVWVGSLGETVTYISPEDDSMHTVKTVSAPFTFTPYCLPLNDGTVLSASFDQGFSLIDGSQNHVRQLAIDPNVWRDCIKRSVFVPSCMHQTSDGMIWVGTLANGLFRFNLKTMELVHISGAPCLDITSIEEDESGDLWISTQYGLGLYDRASEDFTNWFADDGIGGNQFYDRASCRLEDGTLVFGGTHGLTVFDPKQVAMDREVPVYFEDLKIHNVLVRPGDDECITKSLVYNPDIDLDYEQNCFSISFAALEYSEYERVEYQYMLDGFDGHWINANNNREAYYSNIPAGKYSFKVRILNKDHSSVLAEKEITVAVGAPFWFSWWAFIVYMLIAAGAVYLLFKARSKITAEKMEKIQAQQEKEQERRVNKMNMNFFANVAHEFRTPLTMISGPVAQLAESSDLSSESKRLLDIVQRNIHRMLRLVNQQLDFNKLENDTLKLSVRQVDVIAQLADLTDVFRMNAEEKGIAFKAYGLEDSVNVWVDDDKLDKICFNLLSNALKFTPYGGKVEFSLDVISRDDAAGLFPLTAQDVDTRYLKIAVRDSGKGIPADQLEKVFERYYQVEHQVGVDINLGTGIGLYFARTLAMMHHGYLKAENQPVGTGAIFTLILPISEATYSDTEKYHMGGAESIVSLTVPSARYVSAPAPVTGDNRKKILIVDDDTDVIHYLRELLNPYYEVLSRFDADAAYQVIKEEAIDLVVSDVVMSGTTGYELCRQIKENIQISHIPVILLTAKANVGDQVQGLDSGADAYVTKPFEPQYLLALIQSQLKNREKIRDILSKATDVETLEEDALSPQDSAFMTELYQLMENELANSELDVSRMTEMLHISRTKFYYKVKGLTGENPSVFFKRYKLNRAAQLLLERKYNISEIADMTGFSTLSHFSTSFKKQFGVSPSEYVK